jgi:hypothetical protein
MFFSKYARIFWTSVREWDGCHDSNETGSSLAKGMVTLSPNRQNNTVTRHMPINFRVVFGAKVSIIVYIE